jgi:hypothetical protein
MYLSRATVQHSKFARLRTAFKFTSASFEVRKTSDSFQIHISIIRSSQDFGRLHSQLSLRTHTFRIRLRTHTFRTWLTNLYLPNSTCELDRFRCKCFVPVHQRIAYIQNFWFSLVPSSCLSHTSPSAESFILMTIQFALCATT